MFGIYSQTAPKILDPHHNFHYIVRQKKKKSLYVKNDCNMFHSEIKLNN